MKKIFSLAIMLVVVAVVALSIAGCIGKKEVSSLEEALYATKALPEYGEIISYVSIEGYDSKVTGFSQEAFSVGNSKEHYYRAAHVVIYKDKRDSTQVIVWDDQRPPQRIKLK